MEHHCGISMGSKDNYERLSIAVRSWKLAVVLKGLKSPPFELLQGADVKFVSSRRCCCLLKPLHVNNIHTLSAHLSCTQFFTGDMRMILKPNLAFVPKVVGLCSPIDLAAFAASPEGQCAYALRPFHAVRAYVDRTRYFRRRNLLFFSWSPQGQTCLQVQTSPANQIGVMRLMLLKADNGAGIP